MHRECSKDLHFALRSTFSLRCDKSSSQSLRIVLTERNGTALNLRQQLKRSEEIRYDFMNGIPAEKLFRALFYEWRNFTI
jgi:hypothetical protein